MPIPRITNRIARQMQLTPFLRSVKASREHFARCFACSNWDAPAYAENPAQIKSIKPIQIIISISPIKTLPFHAQSEHPDEVNKYDSLYNVIHSAGSFPS